MTTTPKRCIKCGISERYRPEGWTTGTFQPGRPAAGEPRPKPVEGPLCGSCSGVDPGGDNAGQTQTARNG